MKEWTAEVAESVILEILLDELEEETWSTEACKKLAAKIVKALEDGQ